MKVKTEINEKEKKNSREGWQNQNLFFEKNPLKIELAIKTPRSLTSWWSILRANLTRLQSPVTQSNTLPGVAVMVFYRHD